MGKNKITFEEQMLQVIDERDKAQDMADALSFAIAKHFNADIGEHSNLNDPWKNALGVLEDNKRSYE